MQKREIDKRIAKFIRENPSIEYMLLIDQRGIPLSGIASRRSESLSHEYATAVIRILNAPAFMLKTAYNLSEHLITISMFEEKILLQVNLETHILALFVKKSHWPVFIPDLVNRLNDFYYMLTHGTNHKKSHLAIIYASTQKTSDEKVETARQKVSVLEKAMNSLFTGNFNQYDLQLTTNEPREVVKIIGQALSAFTLRTVIINPDNDIIYMHPDDAEKMAYATVRAIQDLDQNFKSLNAGALIANIHYFMNGEVFISTPLGAIDGKRVELCNQLSGWQGGLNELFSYNYSAATAAYNYLGSPESQAFIEMVNYLLSDIDTLQQEIERNLDMGNNDKAISLMKRASYLLQVNQQYTAAGDFLKWVGYTYYEQGNPEDAITYYKEAAKLYERAEDYGNLASVYTDIASIYENIKDESAAIVYFQNAYHIYEQLGDSEHTPALMEKINELFGILAKKIQDYVKLEPFESKPIEDIAKAISVSGEYLPSIMDEMVKNDMLKGRVDLQYNLYYKYETPQKTTAKATTQGMYTPQSVSSNSSGATSYSQASSSTSSEVVFVDYSNAAQMIQQLVEENHKLDKDITDTEMKFADRGVRTTDFLKYQAKIQKRTFNNKKIEIYQSRYEFNTSTGVPIRCPLCLKEFQEEDKIVTGPGGHGFHTKCISKWIKTQDKCPICDRRLLPDVFESSGLSGNVQISTSADQEELERLRSELELLKSSSNNNELMQKLLAERETKARLMRELNQKDRIIRELKSQLEIYKRGRL